MNNFSLFVLRTINTVAIDTMMERIHQRRHNSGNFGENTRIVANILLCVDEKLKATTYVVQRKKFVKNDDDFDIFHGCWNRRGGNYSTTSRTLISIARIDEQLCDKKYKV